MENIPIKIVYKIDSKYIEYYIDTLENTVEFDLEMKFTYKNRSNNYVKLEIENLEFYEVSLLTYSFSMYYLVHDDITLEYDFRYNGVNDLYIIKSKDNNLYVLRIGESSI